MKNKNINNKKMKQKNTAEKSIKLFKSNLNQFVKFGLIVFVLSIILLLLSGCSSEKSYLGSDKDKNGCIGSAGYSWCEEKQKCIRSLEENCSLSSENSGEIKFTSDFNIYTKIQTKKFKTEKEYSDFIKQNSYSGYPYFYPRGGVLMRENIMSDSLSGKENVISQTQSIDYSKTNNQVENVDEADMLKTDGEYIYTISNNIVYIIKSYPGEEAEIVSTIKHKHSPQSLFIYDKYLAVFGNIYSYDSFRGISFTPTTGMSFFEIYDISDKQKPKLVKEYKFEGNYFRGRMKDSYVYFITTTMPQLPPTPRCITPFIIEGEIIRCIPVNNIYYYNINYQNPIFVNIHSINLGSIDEEVNSKSIAVEGSHEMYMSEYNIYITYTEYINEYDLERDITMELLKDKLSESDKKLIEKINSADSDVLSKNEKKEKIWQVYQRYLNWMNQKEREELQDNVEKLLKEKLDSYKYLEYTVINKISVNKNSVEPVSNGKVPGHIINQFSMDEHNNVFRIATTISPRWSRFEGKEIKQSTNNVYALDSNLQIIGFLEGLAENEQIYSTRFIGDRLYMVTFRQIDPFFVIDLSNPTNIKTLGKLKIPGFSRYLHPYDENTIIGLGQDVSELGRIKGLKVSLFDVRDVENPKEIAKYVTDEQYAQSTALFEHKAFLFSREKELLVIPIYYYEYNYDRKSKSYNGALVFKITKDEIKARGLIDHSSGKNEYYWQPAVERSLYINDLLYTKSLNLLRINRIDTLEKVKNIELNEINVGIPVY